MSMKVPIYEPKVSTITPVTEAPRMPQITMPRVTEGAFGTNVGEAVERLGKVGEQIAGYFYQRAQDSQDKDVLDRETAYRQEMQGILFNNDTETVTIGGKEITRPKGLLLRQLEHAEGSTNELVDTYHKIREKYVDGISYYQAKKLVPAIKNYFASIQEKVILHEVNQRQESEKNSVNSNLDQVYLDASTIRTGDELSKTIDKTQSSVAWYLSRFDSATQKVKNEGIAGKIIKAATLSTLQNTGDLTLSQSFLDSAKDKIAQSTYDGIKSELAKDYDSMQTDLEKIRLESRVTERFNYIAQIANGTLNWQNSAEIINKVATTDPDLAEAMKKAVEAKSGYIPEEVNNESFQSLAKDIFNAKDSDTISKFLLQALKDNKNISKDRLAILVGAAGEKVKELNIISAGDKTKSAKKGFWNIAFDAVMLANPLTAPYVLMNIITRAKTEGAKGEQIINIANDEIRKQRLKDNPTIATFSGKGRLCYDKFGNKAMVYPDGSYEEVQSSGGQFIHKEQRKKEKSEEK